MGYLPFRQPFVGVEAEDDIVVAGQGIRMYRAVLFDQIPDGVRQRVRHRPVEILVRKAAQHIHVRIVPVGRREIGKIKDGFETAHLRAARGMVTHGGKNVRITDAEHPFDKHRPGPGMPELRHLPFHSI